MPGINGSYDAVFPSNDTIGASSEQQVENGKKSKKENSIFYSSYDDNKSKTIEYSDATTKKYIDNGCNVQEDSSLAQNVKAKIKTSIAELYKKATAGFSNFGYDTTNSTPDVEVEANLSRQVQSFNQATQTSYVGLVKQAKLEAEQELSDSQKKENALKANDKLKISNEYNQNNGIEGDFTTTSDENGNIKTITVKSDKSGNQFTYQRNEDGNFVQVDKNGNQVKDKNGNVKEYSLSDDGNLQRTNNQITLNGKTYTKNAYGDYDYNGKSYFYDNGQMIPIQQLDEVVVIGDKSKVKTPKIDLASAVTPKSPDIDMPKIDMEPLRGSMAKASLKEQGAKFIEREVNGEQREIAVYHNSEGEKVRQVINEDGTLENLVAISTLGKNKYITQTEANKELIKQFGAEVADVLIEKGAVPVYEDGEMTAVKVDGRTMIGSELIRFVREQISAKDTVQQTPTSEVPQEQITTPQNHSDKPTVLDGQGDFDPTGMDELMRKTNEDVQLSIKNPKEYLEKKNAKFIEREVNGVMQQIAVYTDSFGEKTHQIINEKGQLENLVPISTKGKNKYITQTEANKELKKVFDDSMSKFLISSNATPIIKDGEVVGVNYQRKDFSVEEMKNFLNLIMH